MTDFEIELDELCWDEIAAKAAKSATSQVLSIQQEQKWTNYSHRIMCLAVILMIQFSLLYFYQIAQLKIVQMQLLLTLMQT